MPTLRKRSTLLLLIAYFCLAAAAESPTVSGYGRAGFTAAGVGSAVRYGEELGTRISLSASPSPGVTARVEGEYRWASGYAHPLGRYAAAGLPEPAGVATAESIPGSDLHAEFLIDHAWVSAAWGPAEIALGKMPLSRGSAWLINPTDRVNRPGLDSLGAEESPGYPAVSLDAALGWRYGVSGNILFTDTGGDGEVDIDEGAPENTPFALHVSAYPDWAQLSAGVARESRLENGERRQDYYLLFDLTSDIGKVGITAETALKLPEESGDWKLEEALESSVGLTYLAEPLDTELMAEYIHLGSGAAGSDSYDYEAFLAGDSLLLAEEYLFLRAARSASPEWTLEGAAVINLNDGSLLAIPSLEWEPQADLLFSAAVAVPLGGGTDEFGGSRELVPGNDWQPWDDYLINLMLKLYF